MVVSYRRFGTNYLIF